MNSRSLCACVALGFAGVSWAQTTGEAIGVHNLGPGGGSPLSAGVGGACTYCHAPHSGIGGITPLWNQQLSNQVYNLYTSTTDLEKGTQPTPGSPSTLCLSCHDGSIAPGQTAAYGKIPMSGGMKSADVFGSNLTGDHPTTMALPLKDSPDLAASIVAQGKTADPTGAVHLVNGNVECNGCHNPHVQAIDSISQNFLVRDSSSGQLCLACHDPNRVTTGQINPIAQWSGSAHAAATNTTSTQAISLVGGYQTVAKNACNSCHQVHNAPGASRLLRGANEQDCINCHAGGSNISPAIPNVYSEFNKIGHPFPAGNNLHDAAEPALLNQNRHATCVDCHNPHASQQVLSFTPAPNIRISQTGIAGISSSDGVTVMTPSVNQYDNCLRCHGTSTGKVVNPVYGYLPTRVVSAGDPLNLIPQFALTATSSHPVMHVENSALPQPSLLSAMLNLDGVTQGRSMGSQIFCTDCHNSDDNREFGGAGPNGPHGSKFSHILERRYEISQAVAPGQSISNLFPTPDLSAAGPYALCGKCHSLTQIMANTSFSGHSSHINQGFSCSACHTAHGMGATSANITGERLVNFDGNVVAPTGATPISYSRATNSCTLTCHNYVHNGPAQQTGAMAKPVSNLRSRK
ncbi:MAG TPA: cytochrome c3 family protein [Bryobacteraceae bacterium]|nr:cytochrome c3 family protein [Bryobacteraceae bacterium]